MKTMELRGRAYIAAEDAEEYWFEGDPVNIEVEATDEDEVRIGVQLKHGMSDTVTVYLSRAEAAQLSVMVAAASLAEVRLPA